ENITRVAPPAGWQLYYQSDDVPIPVSGINLHKKIGPLFQQVLSDIWNKVKADLGGNASDNDIRKRLHELRVDQHSGGFNYRPIGNTQKLSMHAYGIAIDWDADHNPQGNPNHTLPDWWYDCWNKREWTDGRHFPKTDPMHVQY